MVYLYDNKGGLLATALRFSHTVVPHVLGAFEFWLFLGIHFAVRYIYSQDTSEEFEAAMSIDWRAVNIVSGITMFFEVFYANQCYARYNRLYRMCRSMFICGHDISHYLRIYAQDEGRPYSRLSTRYINLSLRLLMGRLQGIEQDELFANLQSDGHVKASESIVLSSGTSRLAPVVLAVIWSSNAAYEAFVSAGTSTISFRPFLEQMLKLQSLQKEICDVVELPVPFQYVHLLSTMIIMNLLLWAIVLGTSNTMFSPVIFFFASFIYIGMMELSSALADPFGEDQVDFPIKQWLDDTVKISHCVVEMEMPGSDLWLEDMASTEPKFVTEPLKSFSVLS